MLCFTYTRTPNVGEMAIVHFESLQFAINAPHVVEVYEKALVPSVKRWIRQHPLNIIKSSGAPYLVAFRKVNYGCMVALLCENNARMRNRLASAQIKHFLHRVFSTAHCACKYFVNILIGVRFQEITLNPAAIALHQWVRTAC